MNLKLEAALAYSRMHWRIFPCHSIVDSLTGPSCSCGKVACGSPGKHPRTRAGFKEATDDEKVIRRWWARWPDANIALATGSGLAVFDIDGQEGLNEFKAFVEAHGRVPETLTAQTGRGLHLVYATRPGAGEVRSSAVGKVHVRGEGGYIIVAPSNHISGKNYQWVKKLPIAVLPDALRQWSQGYEIGKEKANSSGFEALGPVPTYFREHLPSSTNELSAPIKQEWSPNEEARLISALSAIPANSYDIWYQVGMALKTLEWERSDGTDIGFDLFDQWSQTCPDKYSLGGCEIKWNSFGRRAGITLGTVYHLAQQAGWKGGAPPPGGVAGGPEVDPVDPPKGQGHLNGHAMPMQALPPAFAAAPILFPDTTEEGLPKSTCTNATVAVNALAIVCEKDLFHERMTVAGQPIQAWAGEMSDDVIQMIRKTIRFRFGFDPKVENTRDACTQLCLENQYDPVCDYLDGLQWDGTPRLGTWLSRYMGAADTELNRTIGRLVLVAAVRRARCPGTKFDQIVVFESLEGRGKSTAIQILAGAENFSDQSILNRQEREQQEAMTGVWLYEIADLTGMKKADIEHIKAFASRTTDRARPAYGRFRVDRPRRTIFFATTNDDEYLKSQTGNRRFWPVPVHAIDLDGLRRDRDQLWAEAAAREARGDSIALPERLWKAAGEEQEQRLESDEWMPAIHNYLNMPDKIKDDVSIMDVLANNQFLQIAPGNVGRSEQMRAGAILRRMGFIKYRKRLDGSALEWRYRRPDA